MVDQDSASQELLEQTREREAEQMRRFAQERQPEARAILESCRTVYRTLCGVGGADSVRILHHLAQIRLAEGDSVEAGALLDEALPHAEALFGKEHALYATLLGHRALALHHVGDNVCREIELLEESSSILDRVLSPGHPERVRTFHNLAATLAGAGQDDRAEPVLERVLALREATEGEDHPAFHATLAALASLRQRRGNREGAAACLARLLTLVRRLHGTVHPETFEAMVQLARCYPQGDERALTLLTELLDLERDCFGQDAPQVGVTAGELAAHYLARALPIQAEPWLRLSAECCGKALGEQSIPYALCLIRLAQGNFPLRRFSEAEMWLNKALDILEKAGPQGEIHVTVCWNNLGMLSHLQGDPARAEPLLRRVVEARCRMLGPEHPLTQSGQADLVDFYRSRGDLIQAEFWESQGFLKPNPH